MPFIKEKFKTYNDFGKADINTIYGEKLKNATSYKANQFASAIFINDNGVFKIKPLPAMSQLSSVNEILMADFNNDMVDDVLLLGNLNTSEVETPRNDASYGTLLFGDGNGLFSFVPNDTVNLWENGDVKGAKFINIGDKKAIIIAKNNDKVVILQINNQFKVKPNEAIK
jgi:hypothetical protein